MKNTRKSLVLSALSMLLCVAMLLGTTFAWFTDSVTSGNNRIVAGNLDVDMLYKSGTMTDYSTVNNVTNNGDGTTPIFVNKDGGKVLWEPGAMVYTTFKIENLGTLAFQYNFALRITGMNALQTAGVKHNLSEVVKAVVLNGEVSEDQVKSEVEGKVWNSIESFEDKGSLLPTNNKYFTVVLYWEPTSNDNLYNVNNGQTTTSVGNWTNEDDDALYIDFDVNLTATQVPYEEDSFDIFYDNIELGLVPATWSGESAPKAYNNGGTYEVTVESAVKATVDVPAGAKYENGDPVAADDQLKLVVEPGADASIKVEKQNTATTYDVSLVRASDNKKVKSDEPMTVSLDVGDIDLVRFYHNGVQYENRKSSLNDVTTVGDFYYDVSTGKLTFKTKSFSPFSPVYKYSGGQGTPTSPYKLSNEIQLQKIESNKNYILVDEINLNNITPISTNTYNFVSAVNRAYKVVIDGNNKKITYNGDGIESLFGDFYMSTLKNVNLDVTAPIAGYLYEGTYDNIVVEGNMEFSNNTGVMGYYCYSADVKNCTIKANVQSTSYSAVFFGYQFGGTFNVSDCVFSGNYTGPYAGLILGNGHYKDGTFNITNVKNNGIIRALLVNSSALNPFTAMNGDSQAYAITLIYNGVTLTCGLGGTADNYVLEGTGQYVVGPEDEGLAVTVNADKTFNITKSANANVDHYEVEIMTNVANIGKDGGSMNISVIETIKATADASFNTKLKNFGFADGTTATYKLSDIWDIITIDDVDYYLDTNPDSYASVTNADSTWVHVRAYDVNDNLLSANIYNYDY